MPLTQVLVAAFVMVAALAGVATLVALGTGATAPNRNAHGALGAARNAAVEMAALYRQNPATLAAMTAQPTVSASLTLGDARNHRYSTALSAQAQNGRLVVTGAVGSGTNKQELSVSDPLVLVALPKDTESTGR